MKRTIKILVTVIGLPFVLLGAVIGVLRFLFAITFILAWDVGDQVYGKMIMWADGQLKK